jgi:hypothetical protein
MQVSFSAPSSIVHQVPEGHVGVYWRGGALLKTITPPGTLFVRMFLLFFFVLSTCSLIFFFAARLSSEAAFDHPV